MKYIYKDRKSSEIKILFKRCSCFYEPRPPVGLLFRPSVSSTLRLQPLTQKLCITEKI